MRHLIKLLTQDKIGNYIKRNFNQKSLLNKNEIPYFIAMLFEFTNFLNGLSITEIVEKNLSI